MGRRNFVNNSLWIIGGKIAQMLLTLIIGAISARYLGPSNYGLINLGAAYTALFTPIISLGLYGIIVNEIVNKPNEDGIILGSAVGLRIISAIISSICILGLVILTHPKNELLWIVTMLQCTAILFQWSDTFNYWCQSQYNSKVAVCIQLAAYIIASVYKIYLLITQKSVGWFAFSLGVDFILQAIFFVRYFQKEGNCKLRFRLQTAKRLLSQSYHYIFSSLASVVYGQIDRLMLGTMLGTAVVGLYTAAVTISSMWTFILSAIIDSVRPKIIETRRNSIELYRKRIIQLYSFIIYFSIAVSVGICFCSKYIISIIYGKEYLDSQISLCILTWGTCFSFLGVARSIWCVCEKRQKYEKYLSIIGSILNVILNTIMIPIFGMNGAAIATLITQIGTNFGFLFLIPEMRENSFYILKAFDIRCILNKEFVDCFVKRR